MTTKAHVNPGLGQLVIRYVFRGNCVRISCRGFKILYAKDFMFKIERWNTITKSVTRDNVGKHKSIPLRNTGPHQLPQRSNILERIQAFASEEDNLRTAFPLSGCDEKGGYTIVSAYHLDIVI